MPCVVYWRGPEENLTIAIRQRELEQKLESLKTEVSGERGPEV